MSEGKTDFGERFGRLEAGQEEALRRLESIEGHLMKISESAFDVRINANTSSIKTLSLRLWAIVVIMISTAAKILWPGGN